MNEIYKIIGYFPKGRPSHAPNSNKYYENIYPPIVGLSEDLKYPEGSSISCTPTSSRPHIFDADKPIFPV